MREEADASGDSTIPGRHRFSPLLSEPQCWLYIPADAVERIKESARQAELAHAEAHAITEAHVSCRFVDRLFRFSTARFSRLLLLPVVRPSASEGEEFVRIEELGLIAAAASNAEPRGIGWRTEPEFVDTVLGLIAHHRAAGVPARELASRGVPVQ